MQAKRGLTGLIATVATVTAIMTGPAVADTAPSDVTPDTYHDM